MKNLLKVEIQQAPAWSFLWIFPEKGKPGRALIASNNPQTVEYLKLIRDELEETGKGDPKAS